MTKPDRRAARRRFLRYLAASPLFACFSWSGWERKMWPLETLWSQAEDLITSPKDAINVFDFRKIAQQNLPSAHYGYLETGVDDDATVQANREGFNRLQLRVRRLIDVHQIDMSTQIFGAKWKTPIVLAPAGSQKAFHPEGEVAVARAAASRDHLQILSTTTTSSVEEVTRARGAPVWYQLYPTDDWDVTRGLLKRAEGAGSPVVVLTVDLQGGSNRETLRRFAKKDSRECRLCHDSEESWPGFLKRKTMFDGLDISRLTQLSPWGMTWDFLRRLKDATTMKVVIKGIVTGEDAKLCLEYGADGIIVSNHGGRAEESARSTIECLPEILRAVSGRIPVLIDGGFRRGTDIFKALALGADAICIGRPYLWGLAAFGQEGVEAVLDILERELEQVMRQAGTPSIAAITHSFVTAR